jgi:hypothetical protein
MESPLIQKESSPNQSLKRKIVRALRSQGFGIDENGVLIVPTNKDYYRKLHEDSVKYLLNKNHEFIRKVDQKFLQNYIIDGKDLDITAIKPVLIKVVNKEEAELFRWVKLHWSVPTSAGYGRRLRYIVKDRNNGAVIGIIGLADPVYSLKDRDSFIGWTSDTKKKRLKNVMDAFVLGAVPPYSYVLGGKLVASLLMSPKIRNDFRAKYDGAKSLISGERFNGKLVAITTTSALGKSAVYDRITIPGGTSFIHTGWTSGSGDFQFINGYYALVLDSVKRNGLAKKNPKWGTGVRSRRFVMASGLRLLGLPSSLLYHNIRRETFLIPLGEKSIEYLRGESEIVKYFTLTESEIYKYAIKRWVIPRSERDKQYIMFKKESYSLL